MPDSDANKLQMEEIRKLFNVPAEAMELIREHDPFLIARRKFKEDHDRFIEEVIKPILLSGTEI